MEKPPKCHICLRHMAVNGMGEIINHHCFKSLLRDEKPNFGEMLLCSSSITSISVSNRALNVPNPTQSQQAATTNIVNIANSNHQVSPAVNRFPTFLEFVGCQHPVRTRRLADSKPFAGTQQSGSSQQVARTHQITRSQPVSGTHQCTSFQPVSGTHQCASFHPVSETCQFASLQPVSETHQSFSPQPVSEMRQVTSFHPVFETHQGTSGQPVSGTQQVTGSQPFASYQKNHSPSFVYKMHQDGHRVSAIQPKHQATSSRFSLRRKELARQRLEDFRSEDNDFNSTPNRTSLVERTFKEHSLDQNQIGKSKYPVASLLFKSRIKSAYSDSGFIHKSYKFRNISLGSLRWLISSKPTYSQSTARLLPVNSVNKFNILVVTRTDCETRSGKENHLRTSQSPFFNDSGSSGQYYPHLLNSSINGMASKSSQMKFLLANSNNDSQPKDFNFIGGAPPWPNQKEPTIRNSQSADTHKLVIQNYTSNNDKVKSIPETSFSRDKKVSKTTNKLEARNNQSLESTEISSVIASISFANTLGNVQAGKLDIKPMGVVQSFNTMENAASHCDNLNLSSFERLISSDRQRKIWVEESRPFYENWSSQWKNSNIDQPDDIWLHVTPTTSRITTLASKIPVVSNSKEKISLNSSTIQKWQTELNSVLAELWQNFKDTLSMECKLFVVISELALKVISPMVECQTESQVIKFTSVFSRIHYISRSMCSETANLAILIIGGIQAVNKIWVENGGAPHWVNKTWAAREYSKLMVSQKIVEGLWSEPIACKTRLGWVVQGPDGDNNKTKESAYRLNICQSDENHNLNLLVKNFFSWDDFGVRGTNELIESKDVQRARKILDLTTKKIDGRYETGLLWRQDEFKLPNSYPMALKRLECLERKMKKDPLLARKMCDYIQDFIEKKYVRKLSPSELQQPTDRVWYLPIFPVFNPKKPEKFRVVWDAAAKVNKVSLNDMLLAGPDLLKPLPDVLRQFRERPIAIVGDMKEMFHQVRVIAADVHAQRFLWRDGNSKKKPEVFVMDVLTFGGKNSPCSAQHVKNKNAEEYKEKFPRAVDAIVNKHYQDDMLECFDTTDETVRNTEDVKAIHRNGGFEMRNCLSNSSEVLEKLGAKVENQIMNLDISNEPTIERVLGMFWNTSTDTFTFSLKFTKLAEEVINGIRRPTKREVLSAIMSIFDPLGLISQYLVYGKILLQRIWRDGTDWDQKISDPSYEHWRTWMEVMPEIEEIEIPRWYSPKLRATNQKRIQLHIFVDASEEACAAGVYYRIEDEDGVDCCLIGAKTKVAPSKPLSITRLELQAAILGIRLAENISKCQRIETSERFFWSDSQTVLGWIQSEARKYHQYVAFRIGEILENSTINEWNWVDTKNNVADDATKWNKKPDLSSTSRWYKAPSFLYQTQENWSFGNDKQKLSTEEEMRSVYLLAHIEMPSSQVIKATNFSNWHRLVRAMAYALRFIDNAKIQRKNWRFGPFSREEYQRARNTLFKQAQREEFLDEILIIRNNESLNVEDKKELHRSSILRTCSPYLDENGLLRVKGRIDASKSVTFNTKRPIILPRNNHITKLLILSFHQKFHHVNQQSTLNQIKQSFYIPAMRVSLKGVIQNLCQRCKIDKAKPVVPEMAELPPERLATFTRPFTYTGVDYFGPMKVKVRRSPEKRWGVIFTCLTTRAVYIDIAYSLDTSSCIYCIRNFSNRMGKPIKFHSDNGSNFQAAEKEVREEFQKMSKAEVEEEFTDEHTQWSFNPPTAAHMGGIWERQIPTIKSVLKKLMPTRLPTDEMLRSYLTEVENIVNSTPLTYVQLDNVDDEVLTPNHFLKGSANGLKSPGRFNAKDLCIDDWRAVQEMTNQFWRRVSSWSTTSQRSLDVQSGSSQ